MPARGYETVFTNPKAGMDGVDRERVRRIVYELSKVRAARASGAGGGVGEVRGRGAENAGRGAAEEKATASGES